MQAQEDAQGEAEQPLHVVFVGDNGTGKTSLAKAVTKGEFSKDWQSSIGLDAHIHHVVTHHGARVKLLLWEGSARERFRTISLSILRPGAVVALVFSLVDPSTLDAAKTYWLPAMRRAVEHRGWLMPRVVLVGTMLDLVDDADTLARLRRFGKAPVTHADALALTASEGLHSYVPVSAKWHVDRQGEANVPDLLDCVLHAGNALHPPPPPRSTVGEGKPGAASSAQRWTAALSRVWSRVLGGGTPAQEGGEKEAKAGVWEPKWLVAAHDREWKARVRVSLLMCRHARLGRDCDEGMRALPDELWECVFSHLRRL